MRDIRRIAIALLVLILLIQAPAASPAVPPQSHPLTISILDVGQGDCTVVATRAGKTMMVDGGPRAAGPGIVSALRDMGINKIDVLVSTHPHADHIGGLVHVLNSVPVGRVIDSGKVHTTRTYENYLRKIDELNIPFSLGRAGTRFDLGEVKVGIIWPESPLPDDINDCSIVLVITYGAFSAMLTGDIGTAVETTLMGLGRAVRTDLLKVAHHGSRYSSSAPFLAAVLPKVAVIPVGRNTYGHPHPEAVQRLRAAGAELLRTDRDGTVTVSTDGSTMTITTKSRQWTLPLKQGQYVASSGSQVYHLPSCGQAGRITAANLITFSSKEEAEKSGRRACTVCKP